MLNSCIQLRHRLFIPNRLSMHLLLHIAPLQLFATHDTGLTTSIPCRNNGKAVKGNASSFVSQVTARHNGRKQHRLLSTRERLGFPPIVRVDKSQNQSFGGQYHPEWGTALLTHMGNEQVEASSQVVLEGTAIKKSSKDPNIQTSATAEENSKENIVLSGIHDAKIVFNEAWSKIEERYGKNNLSFPKEIIWLMGAPGSGKGTHTPFLLQARGITNPPINMSSLLTNVSATISADCSRSPLDIEDEDLDGGVISGDYIMSDSAKAHNLEEEIMHHGTATGEQVPLEKARELQELQEHINKGKMIPDGKVLEILFHALLDCDANIGVLVDGFPRTEVQVECLKLFYDKMLSLRREFWETKLSHRFPRPVFRICVLFVDEDISIQRQLLRGRTILGNNDMVRKTGQGRLMEERVTDYDESLIRTRYRIFKEHYGALLKLAKIFPFHLINALGSIEDVMNMILKEFEYQSSLELDEETYEAIAHIPVAGKIGIHARQDLLRRLEDYQLSCADILKEAVAFVDDYMMPTVTRHAISGSALIRSEDVRLENQVFVDIILDVLSERGYHVTFDARRHSLPVRIDRETFEIITKDHYIYVFNIRFPRHNIQPVEQKMIPQNPIQFSPAPAPTTTTTTLSS